MSLVARHLEAHGISTLCLGSAHDILIAAQPPRAAFVDYPLGHSAGRPFDSADQEAVLSEALQAFEEIPTPGGLRVLSPRWPDSAWKTSAMASDGEDTRQPRDTTPQWQLPEDRAAAIASGEFVP